MDDIGFEDWLKVRFDRPVGEKPWYYDSDDLPADPPREISLRYLHKLFSENGQLLEQYSDRQVNDGLYYLFSPGNSSEIFSLLDAELPLAERLRAVDAVYLLYKDCFFARCSRKLTHLDKELDVSVNGICYMLWDIAALPVHADKPEYKEINAACLAVMEKALQLDHEACRESALHGLGHAARYSPAEVGRVIDSFLKSAVNISPGLLRYAKAARSGMIQ